MFARRALVGSLFVLLVASARPAAAEPVITFADNGQTVLYRARPGDSPAAVAAMFGIPPNEIPGFLTANSISDATRVGPGFVYRIPNPAARTLGTRTAELEKENARLKSAAGEVDERIRTLTTQAREAAATAESAEARAARSVRLERLWPLMQLALVVLALAAGSAAAIAAAAVRRHRAAERYVRALALEVEEK